MNRFDRIVALLIQLQVKRVVRGPALAAQFGISLRTVYRDLRTLEAAGVPLCGEAGVGYSLADGYRLPPVMFSREEATALLTAEKLAEQLTDARTAHLCAAAMDKLRVVLRRPDRDYLESLSSRIEIRAPRARPGPPLAAAADVHQRLLAAIAGRHLTHLRYHAAYSDEITARDVEPIGLFYSSQYWHLVAFCRLRQAFRDFRLDRIVSLHLRDDVFAPRPETLQLYWEQLAARRPQHVAVVQFTPAAAARVREDKYHFGWTHETPAPDGTIAMTLLPGDLAFLARWLLALAGDVTVVSPPELRAHLRELARTAYAHFGADEP